MILKNGLKNKETTSRTINGFTSKRVMINDYHRSFVVLLNHVTFSLRSIKSCNFVS